MRNLLAEEQAHRWADWIERLPALWRKALITDIPILAADETVHLGDNQ